MTDGTRHREPKRLRRIAVLLVRGADARSILDDMDELFTRDIDRGMPRWRAHLRYARNLVGSAYSVWRAGRAAVRGDPPYALSLPAPVTLLDLRLGARKLVRYPVVTILSVLSMAFAILAASVVFELLTQLLHPNLKLPDGDRLVGVQIWDQAASRPECCIAFDFLRWREDLKTMEELGAYHIGARNLVVEEGIRTIVDAVQISASAFRVARVPPAMGRTLQSEDERIGATPVAVIGHELWAGVFGADPNAVGRTVRLGETTVTIVGVMPPGFGFPVDNNFWMPLRMDLMRWAPLEGPGLEVFGLLAPDVALETAQEELTVHGEALRSEFPERYAQTRRELVPFPQMVLNLRAPSFALSNWMMSSNVPLLLVLFLVVGNVALLIFARAAARENDLVVRAALGASRARIMGQHFAEAVMLSLVAALLGLALVDFGLERTFNMIELEIIDLPYWFEPTLSTGTILYAGMLALVAALAAGALPAFKLTSGLGGLGTRLQQKSASGGGFRFGGVWNVVIVCQIAVVAPLTVLTLAGGEERKDSLSYDYGFAAEEFVGGSLRLGLDPPDSDEPVGPNDFWSRYAMGLERLRERLLEDPRVRGVGYAGSLPGTYHPWRRVEVEGLEATNRADELLGTGTARVDVDYFGVLGAELIAGRGFARSDLSGDANVVMVNETFVEDVLGGRNAIGRRIRFPAEGTPGVGAELPPWYEIVGVIEDLAAMTRNGQRQAVYELVSSPGWLNVAVHAPLAPDDVLRVLHAAVVDVDPMLRLHEPMRLDEVTSAEARFSAFWLSLVASANGLAVLLALGGLYAVMSITVSQRAREIGIRRALGSNRRRVLGAVLYQPVLQVMAGASIGALVLASVSLSDGGDFSLQDLGFLVLVTVITLGVCTLAALVPARTALAIEPADALKVEE